MPRPLGRSPIARPGLVVDPRRQEALELRAGGVEHAERRVARAGQGGGSSTSFWSTRVERELGGQRDARFDELPHPHLGVGHSCSLALSSDGRNSLAPSSPPAGISSRTTRRTSDASSQNGLMILFPFRSALPRGPACTARSRSA